MTEAIDLKVENTSTGLSLVFEDSDLTKVTGTDAVAQAVLIGAMKVLGEDFIDPEVGLPWRQIVGLSDPIFVRGAFFRALRYDPRVIEVKQVDVKREHADSADRVLRVSAYFSLTDGSLAQFDERFAV